MKKIIFDLDNTLIMWEDEYLKALSNTMEKYHINKDLLIPINDLIEEYENYYDMYDKNNMLDLIRKKFNINIDIGFIDMWLNELGDCAKYDENLIKIISYLSSKYELAILTNWFTESQKMRLEKAGILKYFDVIGTDLVKNKPSKEAFIKVCYPYSPDECMMVGDHFEKDVMGAYSAGLEAIWYNPKHKQSKQKIKVIEIDDLKYLKNYL